MSWIAFIHRRLRKACVNRAQTELACSEKRALGMLTDEKLSMLARHMINVAARLIGNPKEDEACTCAECLAKINTVKQDLKDFDWRLAQAGCPPTERVQELTNFANELVAISVAVVEKQHSVVH